MPDIRNCLSFLYGPAFFCLLIRIGLIYIASPAPAAAGDSVTLEPIVVTARATDDDYQTGDVNTANTPAFYHKIQRSEFEGKVDDLAEIIEKQTGVQVRQSGGLGSFSSVSLRGASAEQVMVYLDGVLLNDAAGGGVDLSNISLADVESIEIYRGISPMNFDQASIGGVVNIKTIRTAPGLQSDASVSYGSFNTQKYAGFINHRPDNWDYLISGDYLSSDNDFRFINDNGTPANAEDDRWESRRNAGFDQLNLLTRFGRDITPDNRLDFINKFFSKNQGLPSWNNNEETETDFSTDQNISTLKWVADDVSSLHLNTCSQADYLFKTETYDDSKGHIGLGIQNNEYDTRKLSGNTFIEYQTDNNVLQCTLGANTETYTAKDMLSRQTMNKSNRFSTAAGVQDTLFLYDHQLQITPGLRFQHIDDELEKAIDDMGNPVEPKDLNDNYLMPQLGAKYRLTPGMTLKTNISRYHRIPSFFELFGDRGFFLGNPELTSEKGINADAGGEFHKTLNALMLKRFTGYGVVFMSRIDDLISRTYDARGIGKSDNISKADIYGTECNLTMEMNQYVSLTAQYTWQDTKNDSEIKAFNGKQLPGKFRHSWLTQARFDYADMSFTMAYIKEDDMYYDTANLLKAKTKSEINASVSWVLKSVMLTFEVKNIGNDNYEDFNGYPQPGRSWFCSVKYSI